MIRWLLLLNPGPSGGEFVRPGNSLRILGLYINLGAEEHRFTPVRHVSSHDWEGEASGLRKSGNSIGRAAGRPLETMQSSHLFTCSECVHLTSISDLR